MATGVHDAASSTDAPVVAAPEPPRSRRVGWTVLEVLLGLVVVGAAMWPVTAHPADLLSGTLDAPYHAWLGWRLAELWGHGQIFTVVIPDAVAPVGLDLRLLDGLLPAAVTALFDLLTRGNLVLSYNLALAAGIGADLWAGRRLAQVLSARRWVWFACGVAFATAPALAGSAQAHIAFVYAFTLPLLARQAILIARGDADVRIGRIAGLLVTAYLCSAYHLIFGAITFVLLLACWPASPLWARATRRRVWARVAIVGAVTVVVLAPFIVSRLSYERDERAAGSPEVVRVTESLAFSADALGIVTPPDSLWIGGRVPHADLGLQLYAPLRPAFAGYALLAGVVLLALARRPSRRPLLLTAVVLWVLSLGPALHVAGTVVGGSSAEPAQWLPYRFLQALPGMGALRAPTRASYALAAVLTAALAVGLDAALDRLETRRPGALVAVAAGATTTVLLALSFTAPMPTSDLELSEGTRRTFEEIAAAAPDMPNRDGILFVPWGCRLDDPQLLALQSVHRRPYVGCNPPPTATRYFSGIDAWATSSELAALRCDQGHIDRRPVPFDGSARLTAEGVQRLRRDLGVRYLVVDEGLLPEAFAEARRDEPGCTSVRHALGLLSGYGQQRDGSWVVIDLDRPPPSG